MTDFSKLAAMVGQAIYFLVSLALMIISLCMLGVAASDVWQAFHDQARLVIALLDAVGFIVIAMAVFDVSKFLMEEEVFKNRELASPREAGAILTKFLVIISIAVSLEALVFIFDAARQDITLLIYPTLLLIAVVLMVIGLGIFHRLNQPAEKQK